MSDARTMIQRRIEARPGPKRGDALFEGTDYPTRSPRTMKRRGIIDNDPTCERRSWVLCMSMT